MDSKGLDNDERFPPVLSPLEPGENSKSSEDKDVKEVNSALSDAHSTIRELGARLQVSEQNQIDTEKKFLEYQKKTSIAEDVFRRNISDLKDHLRRTKEELSVLRHTVLDDRMVKAELEETTRNLELELVELKQELASTRGKLVAADPAIRDMERTRSTRLEHLRAELEMKEKRWERERAELALKLNDTRKQLKNVSKNEDDLKSQFTKLQAGITRREASARVTVESEQNTSEIYEDLLTFIDDDLESTVLRDLSYDEGITKSRITNEGDCAKVAPFLEKYLKRQELWQRKEHNTGELLRQAQCRNEALSDMMLTKKGQLERKELQNISLAGELAALMSKYRRIEDRLRVKDRQQRIAEKRASEATFKIKTITADTRAKIKAQEDEHIKVVEEKKKVINDLEDKLIKLSQKMAANEIDTFIESQNGSPSDGNKDMTTHAEATSNGSVKQSPAEGTPVAGTAISFFAKLLRSKESTGGQ
jgi:chromosome segregation ATPase